MSDQRTRPSRQPVDAGMTLPEVLISVAVLGLIVAVLSTSLIVTMRQQDNTEGRLNVARAEQSVSMWLPADLSSADVVDTHPASSPCGATVCDGIDLSQGSNVLMLTWTTATSGGGTVETTVSYHFTKVGDTYELWRVECSGGSCTSQTVLDELPGPPGGEEFVPGVVNGAACTPVGTVACTRPDWVIIVSEPLAPDAVDDDDVASESERKDANRVVVTINGGGDSDGAGGGINQISITAGGTVRSEISANSVQGAPSFVEARSRCGGPMALLVDESNSVGGAVGNVKGGVRAFVEALAGTPVQLQLIGFHTYSEVLGTSDWHRYYDMTDESQVNALLASINDLKGSWSGNSGGTNWEEGLFRTFFQANGSTAEVIPDTVVFFTDGVPTFDRLVHRTSPGVVPAEPAPPGEPWPESTGSSYSQVGFNRANYIANQFRRSVRLIGVGVGDGIEKSSQWMNDPGAGYSWQWERGYVRYQQVGDGYESNLRYQRGSDPETRLAFIRYDWGDRRWRYTTPGEYYANNENSGYYDGWYINGTRDWYNVTYDEIEAYAQYSPSNWKYDDWDTVSLADYDANNTSQDDSDGWRVNGTTSWYEVSQAMYDKYNQHGGSSDGWRNEGGSKWVTQAEYEANNTTPDASDGWVDTGSNTYVDVDDALAFEPWSGNRPGDSDQYRKTKTYNNPPYDGYDEEDTTSTLNSAILARLIAGNDYGTPALWNGSEYTNAEVADMYVLPKWDQFDEAMEAVALGECGGTLTLQTKNGGNPAPDPFRYQNSAVTDSSDNPVELEPTVVTTNQQFTTGTFDFAIPSGTYVTVEIQPQNYSELTAYTPGSWSCKAGVESRSFETIDIPDSGGWQGIRVRVAANEAVSCTLSVSQS